MGGKRQETIAQTEDDGRTPTINVDVPAGVPAIKIGAQPAGYATRRHEKIVRWEGTAPKPARVDYFERLEHNNRHHLIIVHVLDSNENPVSGEPVHIIDKDDQRMLYTLDAPTDQYGFARCEILVSKTREKDIFVLVRGIQTPIRLS